MSTQTEVYQCLCDELDYQVARWTQTYDDVGLEFPDDSKKSVATWLTFIKGYYDDAVYEASHMAGTETTLSNVRKVAALCLKCLMVHGGYQRHVQGGLTWCGAGPYSREQAWSIAVYERNYQNQLGASRTDGQAKRSVNGFLVMFDTYLRRAIDAWTNNAGDLEALKEIGKLLGVMVHCMEKHGAVRREWGHVKRA